MGNGHHGSRLNIDGPLGTEEAQGPPVGIRKGEGHIGPFLSALYETVDAPGSRFIRIEINLITNPFSAAGAGELEGPPDRIQISLAAGRIDIVAHLEDAGHPSWDLDEELGGQSGLVLHGQGHLVAEALGRLSRPGGEPEIVLVSAAECLGHDLEITPFPDDLTVSDLERAEVIPLVVVLFKELLAGQHLALLLLGSLDAGIGFQGVSSRAAVDRKDRGRAPLEEKRVVPAGSIRIKDTEIDLVCLIDPEAEVRDLHGVLCAQSLVALGPEDIEIASNGNFGRQELVCLPMNFGGLRAIFGAGLNHPESAKGEKESKRERETTPCEGCKHGLSP